MNILVQEMIPAWVEGRLQPVEKLAVHRRGLRHKAVSVFVMDGDRVLIQQRAQGKYHSAGMWANTCCTHPQWDEPAALCATRRLDQELGITGLDLVSVGQVEYRAEVPPDLIEHELVDVFVAHGRPELALNPEEVQATAWVALDRLRAQIAENPQVFTPWLRIYLEQHSRQIFGA